MGKKVLIVDDDTGLCELLSAYLTMEGFLVEAVHEGEEGAQLAISGDFDFVVLDVMLPGANGFDVLADIRRSSRVPVLMLSARGEEIDRIVGLELGADDYLAKPFNPRELVARLRAVQRRMLQASAAVGSDADADRLVAGDLELELGSRCVISGTGPVQITSLEFSVLEVLVRAAGSVVSREELTHQALGRALDAMGRSVDVHISNLRRKLGPFADGSERIKSVRGVGYIYSHQARPRLKL